jgi:pentapeptide MXKDX repeat protein
MNSKVIALLTGLVLMGSLVACSAPDSQKPSTSSTPQPDAMKQGDAMKKDGDAMKKDGDAMKQGDAMKKDGDAMKKP